MGATKRIFLCLIVRPTDVRSPRRPIRAAIMPTQFRTFAIFVATPTSPVPVRLIGAPLVAALLGLCSVPLAHPASQRHIRASIDLAVDREQKGG